MITCTVCTAEVLKFGVFFYCPMCLATVEPIEQAEDDETEQYVN